MLASSSSVAEWQRSQIRNGTECCALFGWWQATKALIDSSLWMKPLASRKSSARYTVGGAAARGLGFAPQAQTLEVHGLCAKCAQA